MTTPASSPQVSYQMVYTIYLCVRAYVSVPYNFIFMLFLLGKMWILEGERRLDDQTGIMSPIVNFLPIV